MSVQSIPPMKQEDKAAKHEEYKNAAIQIINNILSKLTGPIVKIYFSEFEKHIPSKYNYDERDIIRSHFKSMESIFGNAGWDIKYVSGGVAYYDSDDDSYLKVNIL